MAAARKVNQSNRLIKTLSMLIGSMVVGTAALSWIHDLTAAPGMPPSPLLARNSPESPWNRIVIEPRFGSAAPLPFYHFYIDENGDELSANAWTQRQQDPQQAGTVIVLMSSRSGTSGISRRQWESLVWRVRELQARYQIPVRNVELDRSAGARSRALRTELDQLNRMLQTAGLIG